MCFRIDLEAIGPPMLSVFWFLYFLQIIHWLSYYPVCLFWPWLAQHVSLSIFIGKVAIEYTIPNERQRQKTFLRITITCLYNFDPLKPHFYIVKLGLTVVYIIFLISAQKHKLWYSSEPPRRGGSNEYPQSMFWVEIWKISEVFYLKSFTFFR